MSNSNQKFNLVLDSSQIHEFLTCSLKWYYHYKERLELKEYRATISAPNKGTLVHLLLDWYYNARLDGLDVNNAYKQSVEKFIDQKEVEKLYSLDKNNEIRDFILKRFHLYTQRYFTSDLEVALGGVELGFSKLLFEDDYKRFIVEGRIDLIAYLRSGYDRIICFVDHKTQERINDLYKYKIQFKTYAWATGYDYGLINYFGMQLDNNGKLNNDNKLFRRDFINFPDGMIKQWEQKLLSIFHIIYNMLQSPNLETMFYESRNEAMCSGAFDSHPCQFTHLCEEYNWDMKQRIKEFKYEVGEIWTPWK